MDKQIALEELSLDDAQFIYDLVTQPSFIEHIGDKGVTDITSAAKHLEEKYIAAYREYGFGLWGIKDTELDCFVGVCGLVSRPGFDSPDLGYALLSQYTKQGYVDAAAKKTIAFAKANNINTLNAFTSPHNEASIRVLIKLDFRFEKQCFLPGYSGVSNLYLRAT